MNKPPMLDVAKEVLANNDHEGRYTIPAEGLYPHQWLWDSCFIAIGQRHYDAGRAQQEILSLLRGQWSNGMLPNMVLDDGVLYRQDREMWRSQISPYSPDNVATSGITQPPMLAEAIVQIGRSLTAPERRSWYGRVYQALLSYHQWLYTERDPHGEGLLLQVHPWETGLDNNPAWISELRSHQMPLWIRIIGKLKLDNLVTFLRRDVHFVPPGQRLTTLDALAFYSVQRRLRRKQYDTQRILNHSLFAIEDLAFNCIFIRANHHLKQIAKSIGEELPQALTDNMRRSEKALEQLWDAYTGQYYSRNFTTHKLIKTSTIGTLLPLYAGCISDERAKQLVALLHTKKLYGPKYPVPSVAVNSEWFDQHRYWQGPVWLNTNWLIVQGLLNYGFKEEAESIMQSSLKLVEKSGFYEYFSPLDGSPAGVKNFSWTAALIIDFLSNTSNVP